MPTRDFLDCLYAPLRSRVGSTPPVPRPGLTEPRPQGSVKMLNAAILVLSPGSCSKPKDAEAPESPAPVQVAEVKQESIDRIVAASAILYPVDQAAVMPKISAP